MDSVIDWLMEGDAAIRWQTMRDLLDAPEGAWQAERERTLTAGWGGQLLALQAEDGSWGGGIYSPKWISTTYTLLLLCSLGIPPTSLAGQRGSRLVLDRLLGPTLDQSFLQKLAACDRCVVGMLLQLTMYFGVEDERTQALVDNLLSERMPDGGWNCRRGKPRYAPHHSSFHTTFNVLEGLREYVERHDTPGAGPQRSAVLEAEQGALSMMLEHRLFKSHRTGENIDPKKKFTLLTFPYRWHYNVLRGLEYFARVAPGAPRGVLAVRDPRLQDAIDLLQANRREDGLWPLQYKFSGKVYFDMEKVGKPSRWVTLRALRVLRALGAWEQDRSKNEGIR